MANVHIIYAVSFLIDPSTSLLDEVTLDAPTIWHKDCQLLIHGSSSSVRCGVCVKHHATLTVQSQRAQSVTADTSISSHINYKHSYVVIFMCMCL